MSESQPEKHTHQRPDTLLADERFVRRAMSVVGLTVAVGLLLTLVILSVKVWLAVFAGILLAIFLLPLAASLIVLVRLIYVEGVLGHRGEDAPKGAPKAADHVSEL